MTQEAVIKLNAREDDTIYPYDIIYEKDLKIVSKYEGKEPIKSNVWKPYDMVAISTDNKVLATSRNDILPKFSNGFIKKFIQLQGRVGVVKTKIKNNKLIILPK